MNWQRARAVADAVLFEGYALYPYRPTSVKNQLRWQFGVLAPRAWSEAAPRTHDTWWMESQLLVAGPRARLSGIARCLRIRRRTLAGPDGAPATSLTVDGRTLLPWDEGEVCEQPFSHRLSEGAAGFDLVLAGDRENDPVLDRSGREAARFTRTRHLLSLRVALTVTSLPTVPPSARLSIRVENHTPWDQPDASRDSALAASAIGTHLLVGVEDGELVSVIDPPKWAEAAAAGCRSVGAWPVLAGAPGEHDLALCAPIILYDHPQVAPESPGDLFDATEIDEILTLRTMTLTDEEKGLARATDARVAALIDRVDALSPEALANMHGAIRAPAATGIAPGTSVRLRPGPRRTDAQDLFLDGRIATVRKVQRDVEGRPLLAVTIDDDPAAELHEWQGRFHYFYPDELEPIA